MSVGAKLVQTAEPPLCSAKINHQGGQNVMVFLAICRGFCRPGGRHANCKISNGFRSSGGISSSGGMQSGRRLLEAPAAAPAITNRHFQEPTPTQYRPSRSKRKIEFVLPVQKLCRSRAPLHAMTRLYIVEDAKGADYPGKSKRCGFVAVSFRRAM